MLLISSFLNLSWCCILLPKVSYNSYRYWTL